MNDEDFCSYRVAAKLKELGFDMVVCSYYASAHEEPFVCHSDPKEYNMLSEKEEEECPWLRILCSAPTMAQAQKWLRKRGLCASVYPSPFSEDIDGEYAYKVYQFMDYEEWNDPCAEYADSYESALSAGIEAALKLIEEGEE